MGAQAFVPRSLQAEDVPEGGAPRSRFVEAGALLLCSLAIFLLLALGTFEADPGDPSLRGADWMGAVGSVFASVLAEAFGFGAWVVPLCLLGAGLPLFRGEVPRDVALRVFGDLLILVVSSALVAIAAPDAFVFGSLPSGGAVGVFFGEVLVALFSAPGSFLVGVTSILLVLVGRASFSFIEFCRRCVGFATVVRETVTSFVARLVLAWRQARELRREQAIELEAEAPEPPGPTEDAVLLARLSDEVTWENFERTGAPPLAIAPALRKESAAEACLDETPHEKPRFSLVLEEEEPASADPDLDGLTLGLLDAEPAKEARIALESDTLGPEDPEFAPASPLLEEEPRIVEAPAELKVQRARVVRAKKDDFVLPSSDLLEAAQPSATPVSRDALLRHATQLEKTLLDYGVAGKVEEIHPGPTVTTFELSPTAGTKVSKVSALADDLALGLSRKVRIIAPIPGKNRIGFEIPNDERQAVNLRELVEDPRFLALAKKAPLPVVLGRDIVGAPFYADLSSMPHVIVAGATGAGKSVGLNVMLSSLLFMRSPEELRLLMVDPKVVELAPFDKIPHLLLPVVTDMKQAATALKWAVEEMERRYQLFADAGTKNITTYNRYVERVTSGELPPPRAKDVDALGPNGEVVSLPGATSGGDGFIPPEKLPYIVIVVDEFADLMMQQGKEVEVSIARLAQKARAAGMHVILATQRPSVDVITGMIKANFPSRIAFRVAQKVDSRTILDEQGAEVLLGRGDMLVKLNGSTDTMRVQCPFVSEEEVSALTDHLRAQGAPKYQESILAEADDEEPEEADDKVDGRFEEAVLIVRETQRCSTSWLQRKMTIGYNRAAKIVEAMERRGYVGPPNGSKDREVLLPP